MMKMNTKWREEWMSGSLVLLKRKIFKTNRTQKGDKTDQSISTYKGEKGEQEVQRKDVQKDKGENYKQKIDKLEEKMFVTYDKGEEN